ncbi:MAG: [citrate (pro-3S)-lyase] ligase [Spirochaetes bacterium]|nr:[citrate (pro-3S)-lyase] ligase [Spirochaetota bacterium]
MNGYEYKTAHLNLNSETEKNAFIQFLAEQDLTIDSKLEYTTVILKDERIIASGAVSGYVLKCIAVAKDHQGLGLTNRIVSDLISYQYHKGRNHYFIYTHPSNRIVFKQLNFSEITTLDNEVTLFENKPNGISDYLEMLLLLKQQGENIGSIVMNCNPFTYGHRFLIEEAAKQCDVVHLFIVEEEQSVFPSEVRYNLVVNGIKDLSNVHVHRAGKYIISYATFPSYFNKDSEKIIDNHARLDLKIFADIIAPALGITRRYVGQEPYCPVTSHYNKVMKETLPEKGIDVIEINRLQIQGVAVSASAVRKYFAEGQDKILSKMVPESTMTYLLSEDGKSIRENLRGKLK